MWIFRVAFLVALIGLADNTLSSQVGDEAIYEHKIFLTDGELDDGSDEEIIARAPAYVTYMSLEEKEEKEAL